MLERFHQTRFPTLSGCPVLILIQCLFLLIQSIRLFSLACYHTSFSLVVTGTRGFFFSSVRSCSLSSCGLEIGQSVFWSYTAQNSILVWENLSTLISLSFETLCGLPWLQCPFTEKIRQIYIIQFMATIRSQRFLSSLPFSFANGKWDFIKSGQIWLIAKHVI